MPDASSNSELLRSLGQLARGLSALFWGLPVALIICAETARASWLKPLGMLPALFATGLLLYGLWLMGRFQKQERPWRLAIDRAQLAGLVNFGLCPFLYWQNKIPGQPFFSGAILVLLLSAIIFLFNLNIVLRQLGAMLPDETLRQETRQFTALNRWLLVALLLSATAYIVVMNDPRLTGKLGDYFIWINRGSFWALIFFALLPLAMTMALIWKTKEVILDSVFGARH
jgi:archaellum biogenesis protein FlaJ (TadC family)